MAKRPPHILVTTPESLYLLLTSESGRACSGRAHGDRRRDPRRRRGQARLAPGALAGAAGGARRDAASRASVCRRRRSRSKRSRGSSSAPSGARRTACTIVDTGHAAQTRPGDRDTAVAARGGDVERGVGARSTTGSPNSSTEHRTHARLRQHAPPRRARCAAPLASGSARSTSPRITAACRASSGSRRAAAEERRAARRWSPPRRSSSASTSATWTWCARSARRARSRRFLQRVGRSGHALGGMPEGRGCSR